MQVLVCPACRTRTPERLDVRTLERTGDVLACACGRRYPIVDGVPIVLADPTSYLATEIHGVIERDLSPEVAAMLVAGGPDDAPYPRLLEHLSIYLDAHWGDRAQPPPDGPITGLGAQAIVDRIAERGGARVELAVELGCSVGRIVAELARGADHVVGVDLQFGAIRRARRLLAGETIEYARRIAGRNYRAATTTAGDRQTASTTLVCGDALDPPLIPGVYGRVVAVNLLDSVRQPLQLLSVLDGLCARGGEIIIASPFTWQSSISDDDQRIGTDDPARALREIFETGHGLGAHYAIEDQADLPWTLRRDARSSATYCIHYIRARKH